MTENRRMTARLAETAGHLRKDVERVHEPKLKAMFETAAEVLEGLQRAFEHYEAKREPARH